MERWTPKTGREARSQKCHSLARKYSVFTALLLAYVVLIFLAFDYWTGSFNPVKVAALCLTTLLAIGAVSKYTNRILARPVTNLQQGITAVREGRLEPIQVSRTGDEIEFLGESFNGMISDLVASREEVRQSQESLEEKIHERTRALEKVSQEALAASHAKSEFLANMSHELRTPMNGVLGMIEILLDGKVDDEQQEQLQTARGCANTLLALLNDVLDLSKIEAGKMDLEEVPYKVTAVIRECVRTLEPTAMEKGIELRSLIRPEVPSRIAGDPLRFRQIVTNLLSNAVKFTESGFVEVDLEVEPAAGSGPKVLILRVTDTGSGIPSDRLPHIFDEFTQADGSISRKYGGTGLGLTITRKLVEMQGGRITVESVVGRGSCFRVVLPCNPVSCLEDTCKDEPAGPSMPSHEETGATGKGAILIVEDNLVNQRVVAAMLKRHGYQIEIANHGGEALSVLEERPIQLILMDVQMPMVDGIEATRIIRSTPKWKDLPIVAMTAHAMNGDRDRCLREGMNGYLSKPVSRQHLIAVVERHIMDRARSAKQGDSREPLASLFAEHS